MKATMLSKQKVDYLFHHVLGGFKGSHEGIKNLKGSSIITDEKEYIDLLEKNAQRLIDRIHEFRLHEKLLSVLFACLFFIMQISNTDMDMRRGRRVRSGRKRNETEQKIEV